MHRTKSTGSQVLTSKRPPVEVNNRDFMLLFGAPVMLPLLVSV